MRTPGEEVSHAAGFCLGEGIVDTPDDLAAIGFCDDQDANVVTVTLSPSRRMQITHLMDRRGFISQTSCGICGRELVDELHQMILPVQRPVQISLETARTRLFMLSALQPLRKATRAAHAAVIFGTGAAPLCVAEDVGRHNALDKAIGRLFLQRNLHQAETAILSSRISYELVQKTARAQIPVLLAVSRPTSLAVELARRLNMTLGCLSEDDGLYLYTGEHRVV
jgi:FdhD protein